MDHPQHGEKGVYYRGSWVNLEDCAKDFDIDEKKCSSGDFLQPCPRSRTRYISCKNDGSYDVVLIGAGCLGAAIARELSRYNVHTCWVDASDDVSQGATQGNSGVVHVGYDEMPGTNKAKYCWAGNQLFAALDKELRFGYQMNGSLVVAFNEDDRQYLNELKKNGEVNGVKNLRILEKEELLKMEPHVNKEAVAALYAPDAGKVNPCEYTCALAENAVDNGVEFRIRRKVAEISETEKGFSIKVEHWEPEEYLKAISRAKIPDRLTNWLQIAACIVLLHFAGGMADAWSLPAGGMFHVAMVVQWLGFSFVIKIFGNKKVTRSTPLVELVEKAQKLKRTVVKSSVSVDDMIVGGHGSQRVMTGEIVKTETIRCRYVINCAGGFADKIARMVGDESFQIGSCLGDYILLDRNQGKLSTRTLILCPGSNRGKDVLVHSTIRGNLILGATFCGTQDRKARDIPPGRAQEYVVSNCRMLLNDFDMRQAIEGFSGARARSSKGDWIIGPSSTSPNMIHVAGIDSPGLAASPAIAMDVLKMLKDAGLKLDANPIFKPNRAPIIMPKDGMKGLIFDPSGKSDSDGSNKDQMARNVICQRQKVTELEVVRAMRRSLPIDSCRGIQKRTRAGMGNFPGDPNDFLCEARIRSIIARESGVSVNQIGGFLRRRTVSKG